MKTGYVTGDVYDRSVYGQLKKNGRNVAAGAVRGEDCAFFRGNIVAQSLSVYTGKGCGAYSVYAAGNQAAAAGNGEISGILLRILLPEGGQEQTLREIADDAARAAEEMGTGIADVKANVTAAVREAVATASAVAAGAEKRSASCPGPGCQVVMTKWAGLEGSVMLAERCEARLLKRYPGFLIEEAKNFRQYLSVLREAAAAGKSNVSAMCAVAEGGVFGALWTLAERAGVGLAIDLKKIPIRQETVEICNDLDVNPYALMGNGSLLCLTGEGEALVLRLREQGIPSTVVGVTTDSRDRVVFNGKEKRFLEPVRGNEICRVLPV